jgi:ABC-type multidrug transport system fused ATPase/permease subunit
MRRVIPRTAMRRYAASEPAVPANRGPGTPLPPRNDWQTIRSLLPYLLAYKARVAFALSCLLAAKVANLGVPIVMKAIVDRLTPAVHLHGGAAATPPLLVALGGVGLLVVAYAVVRLSTAIFTELREILFIKVTESAVRQLALQVFRHLHALSLRFHLDRQTGGMSRDIERGTRGIQTVISYSLYSILPTLVEVGLVLGFFVVKYEAYYAIVTLIALVTYIVFTVKVTEWRTHFRRTMNELDSRANSRAIDSLLNYEPSNTSATRNTKRSATTKTCSATAAPRSSRRTRCRCSTAASRPSSPPAWCLSCGAPRKA